jgi:hypothetical protein
MYIYFNLLFLLLPIIYYNKNFLIWNILKYSSRLENYLFPKNKGIKIKSVKNLENNKKLDYRLFNKKLKIIDKFDKILVTYKIDDHIFKVILDMNTLNKFEFMNEKIKPKIILSALNQNNEDITEVLNSYSGPKRNFNLNILKIEIKDILKDTKLKNTETVDLIDSDAIEYKLNFNEGKYFKL